MSIVRFNPFTELDRLHRELTGLFHQPSSSPRLGTSVDQDYDWTPSIDIFEDADKTVITAMLPGLDRKDVQVSIENRVLSISGERSLQHEESDEHFSRVESAYGKFYRSFMLPATFDLDKVDAQMDKGVLTITLPKREDAKPKQISVNVH